MPLLVAAALTWVLTLAPAAASAAGGPLSVKDIVTMERATGLQVSPDGRRIVWERRGVDAESGERVVELMLSSAGDGKQLQLTRGGEDRAPRFSPDGAMLAFLAADDEEAVQILAMRSDGGESWPVTELEHGVVQHAWLDATTLIFTAREESTFGESRRKEAKDDAEVVEEVATWPPVRLFSVEAEEGTIRRLSGNTDQIVEFSASPDGRWVVTRHALTPWDDADTRQRQRIYLHDLRGSGAPAVAGTAAVTEILTQPDLLPQAFIWALDGSGFYFMSLRSTEPIWRTAGAAFLYWFDLKSRQAVEVPLDWPAGLYADAVSYDVTARGVLALLANGATNKAALLTRSGGSWTRRLLEGPLAEHLDSFDVGPDGATIAYTTSTASTLPASFVGSLTGSRIEQKASIAALNETLRARRLARSEVARWKGSQDDEVTGILYYPMDYQPGRRYPLVLMIHGGPFGVDLDSFNDYWMAPPNLMAARGAFVLMPNYHGSSNHGQRFAESIKGHYYELEIPDILAGIDHLVGRGLVDPGKLGVIGWSNGAILTWELITRPLRHQFKAAAPGAGDVNWSGDYGNCTFGPAFDNYYLGGPPWEQVNVYVEKSPHFRMQDNVTPTLIQFGTEDRSVDTGQGWEAYRAMQMIGKAPVRFILYPDEEHVFEKPVHQERKMREEIAWFDKYLFGVQAPDDPALKQGSPLERALARGEAARHEGRLGVLRDGRLLPEVARWEEGIAVGRFEVTRAQWAAFDPVPLQPAGPLNAAGALDPASADLPVTGITLDQARRYCSWLSGVTGERYRLPTSAEMESLIEMAADGAERENTLDRWAGYAVTPADARLLAPAVARLGAGGLMLPAGASGATRLEGGDRPAAATILFDLDGNASEWTDDEGAGRLMGGCATVARDARSDAAPPPECGGLRVVRESR